MEVQPQQDLKSSNSVHSQQQQTKSMNSNSEPDINQTSPNHFGNQKTNGLILTSSEQDWNIEILQQKLSKLVQFIKFHYLEHTQIWKNKKQLSISQFAHLLNQKYGFYLSNDELTALLKLSKMKQSLKPNDFQPFGLWLQETSPFQVSRYSAILPAQTTQYKKFRNSKNTNHNDLSTSYNCNRQNLSIPQDEFCKHSETFKQSFNLGKTFANEGFKEAQKYSKSKVQMKVQQLKKDIKESVLEKKWDFIVMAGEMNQWIEKLNKEAVKEGHNTQTQNLLSYRFKVLNRDPVQIIQQDIDLRASESIPHVVFVKKYQTLKKKMVKQENNKNNLKGTVLMVLEDQDKFSKNVLINRINQRDQELNFVLLQIMRMKSMFQWQNKILQEAGINS